MLLSIIATGIAFSCDYDWRFRVQAPIVLQNDGGVTHRKGIGNRQILNSSFGILLNKMAQHANVEIETFLC